MLAGWVIYVDKAHYLQMIVTQDNFAAQLWGWGVRGTWASRAGLMGRLVYEVGAGYILLYYRL